MSKNTQPKTPATLQDIFDAVNASSEANAIEFKGIKQDISELKQDVFGLKQNVSGLHEDVSGLQQDMTSVKGRLDHIESQMVTKDYLDEKMSDLRGDLVVLVRKEDNKLTTLVTILQEHNVLTPHDVQRVLSMELFAKTATQADGVN